MGICFSNVRIYRNLSSYAPGIKRTFKNKSLFVKLVNIYDGDTFTIDTRLSNLEPLYRYQLRLAGIDAPEIKPPMTLENRDLHVAAGKKVRDILQEKFPASTIFVVDFDSEDKYGRLLGTVWSLRRTWFGFGTYTKDLNVCEWLLDNNLALPYTGNAKREFPVEMLQHIRGYPKGGTPP